MTPQFEAACIAAATIMAAHLEFPSPSSQAAATWKRFKASGMPIGEGLEGDECVGVNDAEQFADFWETLTEQQRECVCSGVCTGSEGSKLGVDDTTYVLRDVRVTVPLECDMILHSLRSHIDL